MRFTFEGIIIVYIFFRMIETCVSAIHRNWKPGVAVCLCALFGIAFIIQIIRVDYQTQAAIAKAISDAHKAAGKSVHAGRPDQSMVSTETPVIR